MHETENRERERIIETEKKIEGKRVKDKDRERVGQGGAHL